MSNRKWILVVLAVILLPGVASAAVTTRRFVLAAGVNAGGPDRVPLRYAVTDATQFAEVMIQMGGVDPADRLLLQEPNRSEFEEALAQMRDLVATSSESPGRTEVLFYYSGHADEEGLLIGEERLSYTKLRQMMDAVPADVRITVLDACASGAITRIKGGQRRQAFLVDDSSNMSGYAFLTSSSADEAAQESDQIGSSFFTHYLITGMRGAADVSGDGKVSLTEAYEFSFDETLESTTEARGGAQHPAYEINLTGTGDVVMTDLREISAGLLLSEDLSGRFFVRNADRQLVAELFKPAGRTVELGLEPGEYKIYMAEADELYLGSSKLEAGDRLVLQASDFQVVDREQTISRGVYPGADQSQHRIGGLSVAKRHRIGIGIGYWDTGEAPSTPADCTAPISTDVQDVQGSLFYGYWTQERLAATVAFRGLVVESQSSADLASVCEASVVVATVLFGVRYYPWATPQSPLRPYLTGSAGPYIGVESTSGVDFGVTAQSTTQGSFGGLVGGGMDIMLGRHMMADVNVGYNVMKDFNEPLAGKKNYGGFEFGIGFSVLIGKGM